MPVAVWAQEGQEERRGAVGALCDELCQDISRASGGASGQAVVEPCTALGAALQAWALRWRLSQLLEEVVLPRCLLLIHTMNLLCGLFWQMGKSDNGIMFLSLASI